MEYVPCHAGNAPWTQSLVKIRRAAMAGLLGLTYALFGFVFLPYAHGEQKETWQDGSKTLSDGWRTYTGDDPAYSAPDYDDAAWAQVSLPQKNVEGGWRWYRIRLKIPSSSPALAILVRGGAGTYEVFLNGNKIPAADLGPKWQVTSPRAESLAPLHVNGYVLIALRTFVPYGDLYRGNRGGWEVRIGTEEAIASKAGSELGLRLASAGPSVAINLLIALAGLAVLTLFAAQRDHLEYLWLGIYLFLSGTADGVWTLMHTGFVALSADFPANCIGYLGEAALVEFTFFFVGRRVNFGWRVYQVLLGIGAISTYLFYNGTQSRSAFDIEQILLILPLAVLLPTLLLVWYLRGNREAGWLILPICLSSLTLVLYDGGFAFTLLGWKVPAYLIDRLQVGPVALQVWDLANLLFVPTIGIVILMRFTRVSREQARVGAELDAAREIQRNLVPSILPVVPGYRIDAAYFPAAEVGGDLYQVLVKSDGSFLVAVGDVSGKGLKAAMSGAVAIGALRALAAENLSPALLLEGLNRQLVASGNSGFITCLCAEMHRDGRVILANAGHLSPYRNGVELECGGTLPLGLARDANFDEVAICLSPGDKLTLLTDGVVEARGPDGELFGFERTLAISNQSAQHIAQAAQAFGQDDDVTVLTVVFES